MSITVSYKNNTIATVDDNVTTLATGGTWLEDNIVIGDQRPVAIENDVNLYDYDGRLLYSYTAAEFMQLTTLPEASMHSGLVADGWNWDLEKAKSIVDIYGCIDIGMTYITNDEKTRFYIKIDDNSQKTITLYFYQSRANGINIDWGEGGALELSSDIAGNVIVTHTYQNLGRYMITFSYVTGSIVLGSTQSGIGLFGKITTNYTTSSTLYKVEIGNTHRGDSTLCYSDCFRSCVNLETITIPNKYVFTNYSNIFYMCSNLKCLIYPKGIRKINGTGNNYGNYSCKYIILSENCAYASYGYSNCQCIRRLNILSNMTAIDNSCLANCYSLIKLKISASITAIGSTALKDLFSLKELWLYSTTPPTIQSSTLTNLPADTIIYIPRGTLASYQNATNWSAHASKMVEMN